MARLSAFRLIAWIGLVVGCSGMSSAHAGLWCTAYYPGWSQDTMPATNIDFSALTHVIHFAVVPRKDGSLDSIRNVITPAHSSNLIAEAKAAGVRTLICVGGASAQAGFQSAAAPRVRAAFVSNLVAFVASRGYDGIDVDWEPLTPADQVNFTNLIIDLRTALNAVGTNKLLTAAAATQPTFLAAVQVHLDQINLMAYDLAGPWNGWMTWFNSPLNDGGTQFPKGGKFVPSMQALIRQFVTNGVARAKLGIGLPFYGYVWSGGTGTSTGGAALPRQLWRTPPTVATMGFNQIMTNFPRQIERRWDTNAQVPFLSIDRVGAANDRFISYDDEASLYLKVRYAQTNGLGGVMIWELSQGWRGEQPAGKRDPLLAAVKQALVAASGTNVTVSVTNAAPAPAPK